MRVEGFRKINYRAVNDSCRGSVPRSPLTARASPPLRRPTRDTSPCVGWREGVRGTETGGFQRVLGVMFAVSCLQQMAVQQLLLLPLLAAMYNFLLRIQPRQSITHALRSVSYLMPAVIYERCRGFSRNRGRYQQASPCSPSRPQSVSHRSAPWYRAHTHPAFAFRMFPSQHPGQ
jgi:hypothetical protein